MAHRFAYDPTRYAIFFDDFTRYTEADWTLTTVEAGAGSATEALTGGAGGELLITNDNASADADWFQTKGEAFKFTVGKRLHFKARFKSNDTLASTIVFGLQITDTTPDSVTDGIFFRKPISSRIPSMIVCKDSVSNVKALPVSLANDTYYVLEFLYDGGDHFKVFLDGTQITRVPLTNVPDDEELAVSFGIRNEAAAIKTLTVDYVFVAQER